MNDEQLSKLERLSKLREQGAISQQEFDQQKAPILGNVPITITPRAGVGFGQKLDYSQTPKVNWVRWASFGILALLVIAFLRKVGENKKAFDEATPPVTVVDTFLTKYNYSILRESQLGSFKNLNILIDSTESNIADILITAGVCKRKECADAVCNVITMWDNEAALKLYESKRNDPKWRKKNWKFICEHNVADYIVSVGEIVLYPLMDSDYRRWGGKKKRPSPSSYNT